MDVKGINVSCLIRYRQFKVTCLTSLCMVTSIHDLEVELLAVLKVI